MRFSRSQQGMSPLSGLVIIILVGFIATIAFKIIPHYIDNKALTKIITAVETDAATASRVNSPADFYAHISKGMQINAINDIRPQDAVKISLENNEFLVQVNYEKREPVIKNIDLVVKFEKEYRVRAR
ncbi:DUF4845 domain-containing protein [Thiopseudomonas acetoxidans]|uniref:DUF4845 domain-containing protein n=1 Tax=Thiopseudomonas acetoxidans TaxID=3041622 RepID=A0ABT7SMC2_9GAMM|nr:DUF4845 domain-containing protein [Thiopseudomonas sp. CY1220]MDM7857164.1 DUF4845 domain-containing protein [Thiopseudomonas sp. CY1220]NLC10397.1 DUF4845 domain-containing protein [Gammaproteobacteria bacterium]